jgi:hypothetical protein
MLGRHVLMRIRQARSLFAAREVSFNCRFLILRVGFARADLKHMAMQAENMDAAQRWALWTFRRVSEIRTKFRFYASGVILVI